jgi:hypothetical protein
MRRRKSSRFVDRIPMSVSSRANSSSRSVTPADRRRRSASLSGWDAELTTSACVDSQLSIMVGNPEF